MENFSNQAKKHKWVYFITFIFVFMFLFSLLNYFMQSGTERWDDFYKLPKNSLDVVFIGNSHAFVSFNQQIIEDILPIQSYMIGDSGENVFITYFELKEMLKTQQPKIVVLETFTGNLSKPLFPQLVFYFTGSGLPSINKFIVNIKNIPIDSIYLTIPSLRNRIDWNNPVIPLLLKKKEIHPDRGYEPVGSTLTKDEYYSFIKTNIELNVDQSELNKLYLEKIVKLCRRNNIKLILTSTPTISFMSDDLVYYTIFDVNSFAKENDLDLITYSDFNFSKIHFFDNHHLNSFGAIYPTIKITEVLAHELGKSLNQEKVDYFRSFIFSDYEIEHSENKYRISLFPEFPGTLIQYKFLFFDEQTNDLIFESDWQNQSTCEFISTNDNKIKIDVQIKSISDDFKLLGKFRLDTENEN